MGKSLLIVGGTVHCRLSNIDKDGNWRETEKYWVNGKPVVHLQGKTAKGAMAEWRKLRDNPKTAHLFEKVDVMQQPAAVTDSVIFGWITEDLAKTYGASMWTRDVCGGAGGGRLAIQRCSLQAVYRTTSLQR